MRTIQLGTSALQVPVIAVGCMRINSLSKDEAKRFVQTSLDLGANFFDHADVYGGGACEEIFAEAIQMNDESTLKLTLSKWYPQRYVRLFKSAHTECGRRLFEAP